MPNYTTADVRRFLASEECQQICEDLNKRRPSDSPAYTNILMKYEDNNPDDTRMNGDLNMTMYYSLREYRPTKEGFDFWAQLHHKMTNSLYEQIKKREKAV